MTTEQFNKTAFRKGDKIKYGGREYPIIQVDFHTHDFFIFGSDKTMGSWVDCTDVEYIPKQVDAIAESTVLLALNWLKINHHLAKTESDIQTITKQLTEFLNEPF